jgi:hypothetical protein
MVTPSGWSARSAFAASTLLALSTLTFVGCRTNPTNPFLEADAGYDYPDGAGDPLAASLDKLKNRTKDLKDSAAQTVDSAQQLRDDAAAIASDSATEVRQAAAASLEDAKAQGKQLAYDAATGAVESAKAASNAAQLEAIHSLEDLDIEQAGPVLLVAMSRGTPAMQKAAAEQLARRWPPAAGYSAGEIAQQQRDAAIAQLQQRWAEQYRPRAPSMPLAVRCRTCSNYWRPTRKPTCPRRPGRNSPNRSSNFQPAPTRPFVFKPLRRWGRPAIRPSCRP